MDITPERQPEIEAEAKRLGGRVVDVTDKTAELAFPTDAAARQFVSFARERRASVDVMGGW